MSALVPIFPSPSPSLGEEDLCITFERGPMTRQVRTAVLAMGGEPMWEELLSRVSSACRERFSHPIGYFEWVESNLALELHAAWITLHGEETMAERGSGAAREILDGPQRWILRMATPTLLVQAMPRMFGFYYKGGRLSVDALGADFAEISLWATGYFNSWFDEALPAWAHEALRMAGAVDSEVTAQPPDPEAPYRHRYALRWRM